MSGEHYCTHEADWGGIKQWKTDTNMTLLRIENGVVDMNSTLKNGISRKIDSTCLQVKIQWGVLTLLMSGFVGFCWWIIKQGVAQ